MANTNTNNYIIDPNIDPNSNLSPSEWKDLQAQLKYIVELNNEVYDPANKEQLAEAIKVLSDIKLVSTVYTTNRYAVVFTAPVKEGKRFSFVGKTTNTGSVLINYNTIDYLLVDTNGDLFVGNEVVLDKLIEVVFSNGKFIWDTSLSLASDVAILSSRHLSFTGTPEGVVTAAIGTLGTRTDGGAGTTLYVKESGVGNTGWVAK